jgi:hypothetical protein
MNNVAAEQFPHMQYLNTKKGTVLLDVSGVHYAHAMVENRDMLPAI